MRHDQTAIYLIQCTVTKCLRVGISRNLDRRLCQIQTRHPYALQVLRHWLIVTPIARKAEMEAHRILASSRLNGEWFDIGPEAAADAIERAVKLIKNRRSNSSFRDSREYSGPTL